ncbi:YopX family protein [Campylobacter coli]|uniref:YopX family protein n=1 Tax=Campylobacter coli TaxID=195 RepID=UPI0019198730|nr:YopX family protein [Campylobacter coli]
MKLQDFDFRIWDNIEKKYIKTPHGLYIENTEHNDASNCNRIIANYEQRAFYIDYPFNDRNNEYYDNEESLSIELFTGLYDKKDKKVYENDIVKVKSLYDYFLAKISIHKEGTFYFEGKNGDYIGSLIYLVEDEGYTIETIGNIHENPELLKC